MAQKNQNTNKPVFLQFTAEWCGPCKILNPIIDKLKAQNSDKVEFMRIDVDKESETAENFNIRGVPTLILMNQSGEIDWRHTGLTSEEVILKKIDNLF